MTQRYLMGTEFEDNNDNNKYYWLIREHKNTYKTTDKYYLYGSYKEILDHLWGISDYENKNNVSRRHDIKHHIIKIIPIDASFMIEAIKKRNIKNIKLNCFDVTNTKLLIKMIEFKWGYN